MLEPRRKDCTTVLPRKGLLLLIFIVTSISHTIDLSLIVLFLFDLLLANIFIQLVCISRKDPKQTNVQRMWINYEDCKDDFWAAIRSNYDYIMDTNLIDTCKVDLKCFLSLFSHAQRYKC